ncbi:uncharacterized protein LOC129584387 [Paramacrobiotus metropolitanus]|uniref:uncharacterized protein LOC129584387 n=1 Tax=Paramacrobiotus metropolitanus TaxID=2943436 RepID=UPI002445E733|nr:uncharacterized protein LOC129584387 [Paramacrobiotus metropolitanus]
MVFRLIVAALFAVSVHSQAYGSYGTNSASCNPADRSYPNLSGDDLYRQYIKDLGDAENMFMTAAASVFVPGAPISNSSGFFTGILQQIYSANLKLQAIIKGSSPPNGTECLELVKNIGYLIQQSQLHSKDVIPGGACSSLTGEARYQYLLQNFGGLADIVDQQGVAHQNDAYPGKWLAIFINTYKSKKRIETVVNNNDSSTECTNATKQVSGTLQDLLSASSSS